VIVRNGLELESLLLDMMCGKYLIENDDGAVAVARGEYETLAIG